VSPRDDSVVCETPTPGKQPTRIARWKYDRVRAAILDAVPRDPQGVEFKRLPRRVAERLTETEREALGSVSWHTTTVKLDLEVKREIERVPGSKPQRLRRGPGKPGSKG